MKVGSFSDSLDWDRTYSSHFASLRSGISRAGTRLGLLPFVWRETDLARGLPSFPSSAVREADTRAGRLLWGWLLGKPAVFWSFFLGRGPLL